MQHITRTARVGRTRLAHAQLTPTELFNTCLSAYRVRPPPDRTQATCTAALALPDGHKGRPSPPSQRCRRSAAKEAASPPLPPPPSQDHTGPRARARVRAPRAVEARMCVSARLRARPGTHTVMGALRSLSRQSPHCRRGSGRLLVIPSLRSRRCYGF